MSEHSAEKDVGEGWAFLSPESIGSHYFRDGKSFCGRALPDGVSVYGDVFGAGSDPEECRRCARRAHDEADALDEVENALMDAEDAEEELASAKIANTAAWVLAERADRKGYQLDPQDVLDALQGADRG